MAKLRKHDHTLDGSDWDLSTLALTDAPVDQLSRNQKARRVDLSNNQITKLDPSFTALTHLVVLDISKNRLEQLPKDFGHLNKLIRLDLYENRLKSLPLSFSELTRLKWLDLKGNPLEQSLSRVSGDCSNAKQCELCAKNVVKFMAQESRRIDALNQENERKLRERQEVESKLVEKNKLQKEKKKAKVARRNARKARISVDDNNGDDNQEIIDPKFDDSRNTKTNRTIFSCLFSITRIILFLIMLLSLIFIGVAIGVHLQNGNKLESFSDIIIALQNALIMFKRNESLAKDASILFTNIFNALLNWRQTFSINLNKTNN